MNFDINAKNIRRLAVQISDGFKNELGNAKLSPEDLEIVNGASNAMAEVGVLSIGADESTLASLKVRKGLNMAALANVSVAKSIDVGAAMQRVALEVVHTAIRTALLAIAG
jgi:hypothetical protein